MFDIEAENHTLKVEKKQLMGLIKKQENQLDEMTNEQRHLLAQINKEQENNKK